MVSSERIDRPAAIINDFISTHLKERGTDYLLSARSVLFPTNMIMTSLPLSVLTSSIHFVVCWKELTSEIKIWEKQEAGGQCSRDKKL